ncbi:inositol monophosphatase family protein [Rhizobium sp. RU36D]|uniref:inositol monophosphatase family protein n=1 Tax=Rhizobium sp. RU36D TaxID=1907415 RepID=UPI0009D7BA02|nr:inositol monophosphatase family protein [Rhizobium sp. RU36D]SMC87490.1 myo-inositol-1(or 4)-monophosphatase [Rhizobium sp. RU36D]
MTANQARLARASEIVEEAAETALRYFESRGSIDVRTKKAQDFVSEADVAVEKLIRGRLAEAFPGETIVGEEMGGEMDGAYWVIDPIDGTSNFLRGSPIWGISLGFVRAGRPELGVVAMPVAGEIFAAADGTGLMRNGHRMDRVVPFEDIRVMSIGDSPVDELDPATAVQLGLRRSGWVLEAFHCTSVSLVYAARGIFDGYLQRRSTMWDLAGGAVLCREAGLDVRIGLDESSGYPWIATGTPALMAAMETLSPEIQQN